MWVQQWDAGAAVQSEALSHTLSQSLRCQVCLPWRQLEKSHVAPPQLPHQRNIVIFQFVKLNVCLCNIAFNVAVQVKVRPLVLLCVFIWLADLLRCHSCRFFTLCFALIIYLFYFYCFKVQARHGEPLPFQWLLSVHRVSQSVGSWRYGTDGCPSGLHPKPVCSAGNKRR